jgi:phosphatidate cytidylyltransferase
MRDGKESFDKSPQPPFFKGGLDAPALEQSTPSSPPFSKGGLGGIDEIRQLGGLNAKSGIYHRIRTALILAPLVIAAILWLPTPIFALGTALIFLMAAWEWCSLAGLTQPPLRLLYLGGISASMVLLWLRPDFQHGILVLSLVWWAQQARYLTQVRDAVPVSAPRQPLLLLTGMLILVVPWAALVALHQLPIVGAQLVLFLMVLIWAADSAAYFVGRQWGRTKLAPRISPGKTYAGVYGALIGALLCAVLFALWIKLDAVETTRVLLICAATVVISIVGDLYESLLKRQRGLKDSGTLLPGHGGLLDRIDSLTAAAPLFTLGMIWVFS